MRCLNITAVRAMLFLLTDVVLAQQTVFRLSCQRNAIFNFVGHDKRCTTGILWTGVSKTVTRCYQRCVSVNTCNGANMKEETQGKVKCELVEGFFNSAKCKLMKEDGWQFFEAFSLYPSVLLEAGTFLDRRISKYTIEEKLTSKIFIPFDALYCGNTALYSRGQDTKGKYDVKLDGAFVEKDTDLSRMVTVMATPRKFVLRNFGDHWTRIQDGQSFTVSIWLRASAQQNRREIATYLEISSNIDNSFYIKQRQYGEEIIAGYVYPKTRTRHLLKVRNPQKSLGWKHIAVTFKGASESGSALVLYMNGTRIHGDYNTKTIGNMTTASPYLVFGDLKSFSRFAYWSHVLTFEEIAALYGQP